MVFAKPRLSRTGLSRLAQFLEQLEVLHIARADLEAVALVHEQVDVRRIGDLGDDRQAGRLVRLVQQLETLGLEALEGVRGRARLPRAAAQNGRAVRLHMLGHVDDLLLALDRAGAGHHDQLLAADDNARRNLDLTELSGWNLRFASLNGSCTLIMFSTCGSRMQRVLVNRAGVADQTDNDGARAVDRVCLDVPALDMLGQLLNVLAGRALLHNDDHVVSLLVYMVVDLLFVTAEKEHKKSLSSTKRDERQTVPRYHPHSAS